MEVDVDTTSADGTERRSDASDIEVIACYRHLSIEQQEATAGQQMTTVLSGCINDGLPEFTWTDVDDLWSEELQPIEMKMGTKWKQSDRQLPESLRCPNSVRRLSPFSLHLMNKGKLIVGILCGP